VRVAAALCLVLTLAACGGHATRSPEDVVRAWSAALNRNDNRAAARLFANGALIIQGARHTLPTPADALGWNASLPCGGELISLRTSGNEVTALFRLDERPHHICDGPGAEVQATFRVLDGKIVVWAQGATPDTGGTVA
jgi:hypothetical protein